MQIGSEVDVVLQLLCNILDGDSNASKIDQYKGIILKHQPEFEQVTVVSDEYGICEIPWKGWSTSSPIWWRLYNKIKHDRLGIDNGILKTGLFQHQILGQVLPGFFHLENPGRSRSPHSLGVWKDFRGNFASIPCSRYPPSHTETDLKKEQSAFIKKYIFLALHQHVWVASPPFFVDIRLN
ncbi:hypothetical protein [Fibrobacter sp. UWH5]|uniref:hypothetical protein n=1 Tax=Fibrobacter sp. UWH5 TaxID=1896211 RepID=UPI000933EB1E|nr:hypothetical protein [Fibrobacter sp. UWH5]